MFNDEEFGRYKKVVAARKTNEEKIKLFAATVKSQKFSKAIKPYCLAYLLQQCAEQTPVEEYPSLLKEVAVTNATQIIRSAMSFDQYAPYLGGVAVKLVLAAYKSNNSIQKAFDTLERVGIAAHRGEILDFLIQGKVNERILDEIYDKNHREICEV